MAILKDHTEILYSRYLKNYNSYELQTYDSIMSK